jgi:hypothetical protein
VLGHVCHDLGPDPRRGGGDRRLVLGGAVDAQQRGVLVGQAQEEGGAAHLDAEVPVGPAGLDGRDVGSCVRHSGTAAITAASWGSGTTRRR